MSGVPQFAPEWGPNAALLPPRCVLLDLETSGAHPVRDRIIEVALTRVEHGRVVHRWSSLVNPGVAVPAVIRRIVGIDDAMLADAPPFAAIAPTLHQQLQDAVLVAHNVMFDYGFLKQEFARCGLEFSAPTFCTVKFARALEPKESRHGLDALIERYGLTCPARHRAEGDVAVLEQFLALALQRYPVERLLIARESAMKQPSRPPGLPEGVLEAIPDVPGVYLFFGANGLPLYLGKSKTLRSRVLSHFSAAKRQDTDAEIARQITRLEWIETAGDLHAQLVEAELVKALKPRYNKRLRASTTAVAIEVLPNGQTLAVRYRPIHNTDPRTWLGRAFGAFSDARQAERTLRELAAQQSLCPARLGWEPPRRACSAHQLGRCAGVCAGKESVEAHDARLFALLARLAPGPWPAQGPVVIAEEDAERGVAQYFVIDHWCLIARCDTPPTLEMIRTAQERPYQFDLDLFRILRPAVQSWFSLESV